MRADKCINNLRNSAFICGLVLIGTIALAATPSKRIHPSNGPLTRDPNAKGTYSPSGVWGDATLATREKGRIVTEALVTSILAEVEQLRSAPLPGR